MTIDSKLEAKGFHIWEPKNLPPMTHSTHMVFERAHTGARCKAPDGIPVTSAGHSTRKSFLPKDYEEAREYLDHVVLDHIEDEGKRLEIERRFRQGYDEAAAKHGAQSEGVRKYISGFVRPYKYNESLMIKAVQSFQQGF